MNSIFLNSFSQRNYANLKADDEVEMGAGDVHDADLESVLKGFFDEVDMIRQEMDTLKQRLGKLQDGNAESKTVHSAQAMKALRDRMEREMVDVSKTARSIKDKLQRLDRANVERRKTQSCGESSPTDRKRMSVTNSVQKKVKEYMEEFHTLRSKIMSDYRETVERRFYAVTGCTPDEVTLEQILATGESESFLQEAIQEHGREQVMETVWEIQERHDGVNEMEKHLLELHQIFLDMSVRLEAQGDQVNNIESNVSYAQPFEDRAPKKRSNRGPPVPWSSGVCDCFDDVGGCCLMCWAPCIPFGQMAEIISARDKSEMAEFMNARDNNSCAFHGLLYGCLLCNGIPCCYSFTFRTKMRRYFNLREDPLPDLCLHCLLESCALCQEYREFKSRGIDPSLGYAVQARVINQAITVPMAPAMKR